MFIASVYLATLIFGAGQGVPPKDPEFDATIERLTDPTVPDISDLTLHQLRVEIASSNPGEADFWKLLRTRMFSLEAWRKCSLERAMVYSFQRDTADDVATSAMNFCGKDRESFVFWTHTSIANQGRPNALSEAEGFIAQNEQWLRDHLMALVMEVRATTPEQSAH